MSTTVQRAGIRLGLEGAQEVTRGLREIGDAGERNLARVTQEAGAAASALRLLGPILGGLGAGLGIGTVLGVAQSAVSDLSTRLLAMGRDVLGVGEAAETARRSAEEWMASLRDENQAARNVIREVNDLLLTSAERAAQAANANREARREAVAVLLGSAMARGEEVALRLPDLDRQIAAARRQLEMQQQIARAAASGPLGAPTDVPQVSGRLLAELEAQRNNLLVQLRQDQQTIPQLQESLRRLAGTFGVEDLGPPAPPRAAGGGGRGLSADERRQQAVERLREQDMNRLFQERARLLEQLRSPEEAYAERLTRLGDLVERFAGTENAIPLPIIEGEAIAAMTEYERALRQAQGATNDLSRDMQRFTSSATKDLLQAAFAGRNLAETLSNIFSRAGSLFLDRGLERLFGGGKGGGGFDVFGWLGSAIFGGGGSSSGGASVAGARANGGPVEAGRPYLVGERGPEVFVPRQSGGVLPNGQGGAPTIVNNFDFRGATVDEVKFRRIADESARRAVAGLVEGRRESRSVLA